MSSEVFVPRKGVHAGHNVRIAGSNLLRTELQRVSDGSVQPVLVRNQTALYCSCGGVMVYPDGTDFLTAIEEGDMGLIKHGTGGVIKAEVEPRDEEEEDVEPEIDHDPDTTDD